MRVSGECAYPGIFNESGDGRVLNGAAASKHDSLIQANCSDSNATHPVGRNMPILLSLSSAADASSHETKHHRDMSHNCIVLSHTLPHRERDWAFQLVKRVSPSEAHPQDQLDVAMAKSKKYVLPEHAFCSWRLC